MRALVQRVSRASVWAEGRLTGEIDLGLCVFVGIKTDDTDEDAQKLAHKVVQLRIFPDAEGKMNLNVHGVGGALLIVSQFTLYGDTASGNRPSYTRAARTEFARRLYDAFVSACEKLCPKVQTGVFQAEMQVHIVNDGPVTLLCASGE